MGHKVIDLTAPIKEVGESLHAGNSTRIVCPFCNDKTEKTMSITREPATILYHCYRASCGKAGVIGGRLDRTRGTGKEFKPKVFDHYTESGLSEPSVNYLARFDLGTEDINDNEIRWLSSQERIVFPLFNFDGYKWGTLTKAIAKGVKPKTILYKEKNVPSIHFPASMVWNSNELVLVEDVISAIKLGCYVDCAAILGTHISEELALYLSNLGYDRIKIMFDSDATHKALGYINKYKGLLNLSVLEVSKPYSDPKDIPNAQLEEMFK